MWANSPAVYKYCNAYSSGFGEVKEPEDAHGHSPSKIMATNTITQADSAQSMIYNNVWTSSRAFPIPASQYQAQQYPCEARWGVGIFTERCPGSLVAQGIEAGRTTETHAWKQRGARSSCEDVPMPDYNSSSSSRAISSMTGISYEHSKQPSIAAPMDDEQYNLLIQALTPTKAPTIGTRAPSNTPSALVAIPKSLAAADARVVSRPRTSNHASALREISQHSTRDVSGSSNKSNPTFVEKDFTSPLKMGASPSANVRSKKEGAKDTPKENKTVPQEKEIKEGLTETQSSVISASAI